MFNEKMSLEPCKVCGTLNAEGTEICLSCGHSTQGNKRSAIFRWAAIALVICFILPFLSGLISWMLRQLKPESPTKEPQVSVIQNI
jgi:RNA polymerase subunit RPABC4/transcription elongation factor Spt4